MTITVKSGLESGSYGTDGWKFQREYHVQGAETAYEALTASGLPSPGDLYDAVGSGVWITARATRIQAELANGSESALNWRITVTYEPLSNGTGNGKGRPDNPQDGDEYWEFDGHGERIHVDNCIEQTGFPEGDVPDVGLAVGVDENNEIRGLDIQERAATLRVHLFKTSEDVDDAYLQDCLADVAKYNSATWYGFDAGEVFLDSFQTKNQNEDLCEVVFTFLVRRNLAEADIPDFLDVEGEGIVVTGGKKGWQALWAQPGKTTAAVGSGSGAPTAVNRYYRGVWVSDVYEQSDFSTLGLSGTLWPGS